MKTRSQARKFKTEKKLKKIFQCDGNDTIPGSDEDTFLDTVHHSVSHFIGQLNFTNGLHQLNHNRFLVRDHDTNGELKPDKPENYVFVRYLPCTTVGGNNARILICLKCDKNASSFISNILEDTVVSQDILEEKNKSCWHVIAVRSKKPNDARDNPENESIKIINEDPHTSACYSKSANGYGLVYFPQRRGASKGRCVLSEDKTCKNSEHCAHAILWKKEMGEMYGLVGEIIIEDRNENENTMFQDIGQNKHDNPVLRKMPFPPQNTTTEVDKDISKEGHQFADLEDLIPHEIKNLVCKPHKNSFKKGCPKSNGWLHTKHVKIHNYDYIEPKQRSAFFRPSEGGCECRQLYDGFEDMLLPVRGSAYHEGRRVMHLFTYSVMMKFTTAWCEKGTPIENFRRQWQRYIKIHYNVDLGVDKKLWQEAVAKFWNEVLEIDMKQSFKCQQCGPYPSVLVADGTALGLQVKPLLFLYARFIYIHRQFKLKL